MLVSIILCTCSRSEALRQTLASLAELDTPLRVPVELIVVDNASSDDTAEVVASSELPGMQVRCVHEPRRGKGYAYNRGMAEAQGEIFLFTDDDVRVPANWIAGMCEPILSGQADAVAGGVKIAPHLERPWMTPGHKAWFAASDTDASPVKENEAAEIMVGANMAYSKNVLAKVPSYDVELGPGALGLNDDILYSSQLKEAGYRMVSTNAAVVEHHFQEARLTRESLLKATEQYAASCAYLAHHWEHTEFSLPGLRLTKNIAQLAWWRSQNRELICQAEGLSLQEHTYVRNVRFFEQYLVERKRPRNYEKRGLIKLNAEQTK